MQRQRGDARPHVGAGLALPARVATRPGRRSIRIGAYGYSTAGAYFFTIVTLNRRSRFGDVRGDQAVRNELGDAILGVWKALPKRFAEVELDAFVVMPNHVHGIVWLVERSEEAHALGGVLGAFKSLSTRAVNRFTDAAGPLWQRNYFERVIRKERELDAIRRYIDENPVRWELDHENPHFVPGLGHQNEAGSASPAPAMRREVRWPPRRCGQGKPCPYVYLRQCDRYGVVAHKRRRRVVYARVA